MYEVPTMGKVQWEGPGGKASKRGGKISTKAGTYVQRHDPVW